MLTLSDLTHGFTSGLKWEPAKDLDPWIQKLLSLALRGNNHKLIIVMENLNCSIYRSNSNCQFSCNCTALIDRLSCGTTSIM